MCCSPSNNVINFISKDLYQCKINDIYSPTCTCLLMVALCLLLEWKPSFFCSTFAGGRSATIILLLWCLPTSFIFFKKHTPLSPLPPFLLVAFLPPSFFCYGSRLKALFSLRNTHATRSSTASIVTEATSLSTTATISAGSLFATIVLLLSLLCLFC
jgi:hypothetical protein